MMARNDYLSFTVVGDETGQATIDIVDSQVLVNGKPASDVRLIRSYNRPGKAEKIISSVDYGFRAPKVTGYTSQWFPDAAVADRFDVLIAVDTNTKFIDGLWMSSTAAWITEDNWKEIRISGNFNLELHCRFVEFHAERPVDPEGRGWYSVLNYGIRPGVSAASPGSIGLIVDSKLGDHVKINAREAGYFSTYMLPQEFSMVYASDASADSLFNTMIRRCDKSAGELLASIESGETDISSWDCKPGSLLRVYQPGEVHAPSQR